MNKDLYFGEGNAKLSTAIGIFDLPAGWTCPQANLCLSKANPLNGTITDGPNTQFRCYAASCECVFNSTRKHRWNNFKRLTACKSLSVKWQILFKTICLKIPISFVFILPATSLMRNISLLG